MPPYFEISTGNVKVTTFNEDFSACMTKYHHIIKNCHHIKLFKLSACGIKVSYNKEISSCNVEV